MLNAGRITIAVLLHDPIAQRGLQTAFEDCIDLEVKQAPSPTRSDLCDVDVVIADDLGAIALLANGQEAASFEECMRVVIAAGIDREWEIKRALEMLAD